MLIADNTLEGLQIESKSEEGADIDVGTEVGKGEDEAKEPSSGEKSAADEPGISYLSCSSLPMAPTISETVQRATHLRGEPAEITILQ